MKIRTALILTGFLLLSVNLFAQSRPGDDTARQPGHEPVVARSLKVPVILDGVRFPAGYPLPDNVLSFVLEKNDNGGHDVYAFSSEAVAQDFMHQQTAKRAAAGFKNGGIGANSYPSCTWTQESSWFHKSVGCGSTGWLILSPPNEFTELDSISWNNSISCVRAACIASYTVLYACRNFETSHTPICDAPGRLYIAGGDIITDLNSYGFNNRTSSIRFE